MDQTGDPLDRYITELLEAKQLPDNMENHAKLLEEVDAYLDDALMEALPDAAIEELEKVTDAGTVSSAMLEDLLRKAGADPDRIMGEALVRFKNEYQERSIYGK